MEQYSIFNQGNVKGFTVTNPAAGANFTYTIPHGKRWRIQSISLTLTTDANVASRKVQLTFALTGSLIGCVTASFPQIASLAYRYFFERIPTSYTTVTNNRAQQVLITDVLFEGEVTIASAVENIQATDQISDIVIYVEEFLQPI